MHQQRALRYLEEKYCLQFSDMERHPDGLEVLFACNGSFEPFDQYWGQNAQLARQSIVNAFQSNGLDVTAVSRLPEFAAQVEAIREKLRKNVFEGVETFLESFCPFGNADHVSEEWIEMHREEAIEGMNEAYGDVFEEWPEFAHALSDEEMAIYFEDRAGSDPRYLTTYFDSACMGIVNEGLAKFADKKAAIGRRKWESFLRRAKQRIVRALEKGESPDEERRFTHENCSFHENGTQAFIRFREAVMKPGDKVLATHEEYSDLVNDMRKHEVDVETLSEPRDQAEFLRLLEEGLREKPDYLLISEVGRLGNVYPLEAVNEIRKRVSPKTRIIVDCVQSAGRWEHDMKACEADAVILSTQKGSDLGAGRGVLALSSDLSGFKIEDMKQTQEEDENEGGTRPHEAYARTGYAMNLEGVDPESEGLKHVLSPKERKEAVQTITQAFLELVRTVNEGGDGKIDILNPVTKECAHAVEVRVPGVKREAISELAKSFGAYISDDYKSARDEEAVRISFHPFMNHDSLKILTYLLLASPHMNKTSNDTAQGSHLGEYKEESVQRTLDNRFVPEPIRNARQIQDHVLRERFEGKALAIADIGCGDGYHGEVFGPAATLYHGFEISPEMAQKARERWGGIEGAQVFEGNAASSELAPDTYDIVWSLYFTPGNFRDEFEDLSRYDDAYLDKNPAFINIVGRFYEALKTGGKMFLTVYKDKPETEAFQRQFYRDTGQEVVTPLGSRFVATKEDFWSVRWTEESMLSNLAACGIREDQVTFNELNEISWLVEVTK